MYAITLMPEQAGQATAQPLLLGLLRHGAAGAVFRLGKERAPASFFEDEEGEVIMNPHQ